MIAGFTTIPTPTPLIAHNAAEAEVILLIQQMHTQQLSPFHTYLLALAFHYPGTMAQKLAVYHYLLSLHLPIPTDGQFALIIFFGPLLLVIIFIALIFLGIKSIPYLPTLFFWITKNILPRQKEAVVFLELRFPSITTKSAYATEQLYKLLYTLLRKQEGWRTKKKTYSLEIVSTRQEGIRYMIALPKKEKELFSRSLVAFLPQVKIQKVVDAIPSLPNKNTNKGISVFGIAEFKLTSNFMLPLHSQKILEEHDGMSFITSNMTHLANGEQIVFQIVLSPVLTHTHKTHWQWIYNFKNRIYQGKPLEPFLKKNPLFPDLPSIWLLLFGLPVYIGIFLLKVVITMTGALINGTTKGLPFFEEEGKMIQQMHNPYEQELVQLVKEKTNQPLFETSIRVFVMTDTKDAVTDRIDGFTSSLGQFGSTHQELILKDGMFGFPTFTTRFTQCKERLLSSGFGNAQNPILSISELTDLYHFPNTHSTKTEDLVKTRETILPTPLSLKQERKESVCIGRNSYADKETLITLPYDQRKEATYIIGGSNMGKTTLLTQMIYQDIVNGKGVCVIDPHGDLTTHLLSIIPQHRKQDVVYINPLDTTCIPALNILAPIGIDISSEEQQDRITSSVLSILQKQTEKAYWGPRLEHILRNALLTSFLIDIPTPIPTLYTVQLLLTDRQYRKKAIAQLTDPILKRFWEKEFGLYASAQVATVIAPITNKLGKFITNHLSQKILLQQHATIDIANIMNTEKILLVNLSKGALGEDRAFFFGTMITSLLQLAAYQRESIPENQRKDFYLYIDEFQNFATRSFAEIVSETRKYHLYPILSHQNTAQIEEKDLLKIILGNVGTLIAFRTSPADEELLLPFVSPEIKKGNIVNLKPHQFVIKIRNEKLEDAFTGETMILHQETSKETMEEIITYSRKQYATPVNEVEEELKKLFTATTVRKPTKRNARNIPKV